MFLVIQFTVDSIIIHIYYIVYYMVVSESCVIFFKELLMLICCYFLAVLTFQSMIGMRLNITSLKYIAWPGMEFKLQYL